MRDAANADVLRIFAAREPTGEAAARADRRAVTGARALGRAIHAEVVDVMCVGARVECHLAPRRVGLLGLLVVGADDVEEREARLVLHVACGLIALGGGDELGDGSRGAHGVTPVRAHRGHVLEKTACAYL